MLLHLVPLNSINLYPQPYEIKILLSHYADTKTEADRSEIICQVLLSFSHSKEEEFTNLLRLFRL